MNQISTTSLKLTSDISSGTTRGPGRLYIFNHINFGKFNRLHINEDIKLANRIGTDCDVEALQKSFANYGVKNIVYNDLKYEEIQEEITKISTENFSNNSCLIIAVLTHGFQKNELAAADIIYDFDEIILKISTNVHLKSKPKIFILQACRGDIDLRKLKKPDVIMMPDGSDMSTPEVQYYYNDEQYILHSSTEAFYTYRTRTGSPFIQKFCQILDRYGHICEIATLFQLVKKEVQVETGGLQMPEIQSNHMIPYVFGHYCHGAAAPFISTVAAKNDRLTLSRNADFPEQPQVKQIYDSNVTEDTTRAKTIEDTIQQFFENMTYTQNLNRNPIDPTVVITEKEQTDKWVKFCPPHIPHNLVEAGIDRDKEIIYVGRARHERELIPEHWHEDFEFLTGNCYSWVKAERLDTVPSNAVLGGHRYNGEKLYIGRANHDGTLTPGKIQLSTRCLYIPYGGKEIKLCKYEVLVRSS